ncbi:D-alanine-poly(phosphoribitol) ligase, subunit 1 [Enterococcus sp. 8G7_MSG3316]|uniref:D-alanine--D-alanyl carrier protein ligase n=1 Tax=Candidatus Enterococcus testudinis TaxID=1834191 RepID=A0A242A4A0_9ENTE|nr:D-alanine--poly(phosphoribitol) ligase subunit DltA [Enterococcus sp. 8G7_MSG3316]OTN75433.1 D-alanine-poly(phosphoribitol) ligase, subunit 1 [Enterococcus sp. 8G7_MSG3316]
MKVNAIIEAIDTWAANAPDREVYRESERVYTYHQLVHRANQLAHYFEENLTTNSPIVVFGELEFDMLVAFLAASKSGRAYIPIETTTPQERIELILSVAQPEMMVTIGDWQGPTVDVKQVDLEQLHAIYQGPSQRWQNVPRSEDDTYYIIFTSGTTGVPKGVQISHSNLLSFVNWTLSDFDLQTGMAYLAQAPYSFDLSVMDLYPALTSGGCLVPLTKAVVNNFKQLFQVLPTLPINVWVSTPSFVNICLMEPNFDQSHLPGMTHFLFCGEELPKKTAHALLTRFPQAKIFNTYGPTEATVAISQVEITEQILADYSRVPIGYIKEDTVVSIMEDGQLLHAGQLGEIVISGPSVSKGYLNNPEKTAAAFVTIDGQPAYRTGDRGQLTEEGLLLYEGRLDFQIKFHGYRMELEEIDHHLCESPWVKEAVVVPKYRENKVEQLIAYVVPADHTFEKEYQLTKAVKASIGQTLMAYMIPQKMVYVPRLPQTANGKIDRKTLIHEVNPS